MWHTTQHAVCLAGASLPIGQQAHVIPIQRALHKVLDLSIYMRNLHMDELHPIADRVAQHLEIILETFPTNQKSAHGIYD